MVGRFDIHDIAQRNVRDSRFAAYLMIGRTALERGGEEDGEYPSWRTFAPKA